MPVTVTIRSLLCIRDLVSGTGFRTNFFLPDTSLSMKCTDGEPLSLVAAHNVKTGEAAACRIGAADGTASPNLRFCGATVATASVGRVLVSAVEAEVNFSFLGSMPTSTDRVLLGAVEASLAADAGTDSNGSFFEARVLPLGSSSCQWSPA